jgi:hypothetical protein
MDAVTIQGKPPPPGTTDMAAFLVQDAADKRVVLSVGGLAIVTVNAMVCVPESGQLLSVKVT